MDIVAHSRTQRCRIATGAQGKVHPQLWILAVREIDMRFGVLGQVLVFDSVYNPHNCEPGWISSGAYSLAESVTFRPIAARQSLIHQGDHGGLFLIRITDVAATQQ